jgi:transcriptional regulator with XRE-family HTH domain
MAEVAKIYPLKRQQPEPLWRHVLGSRLRYLRTKRGETLAETADRAGISPQYLSEVERGRKEPSSEMIAALAGALDTTLADLTADVTEDLRRAQRERLALADRAVLQRQPLTPPASVTRAPRALRTTRATSVPDILALAS